MFAIIHQCSCVGLCFSSGMKAWCALYTRCSWATPSAIELPRFLLFLYVRLFTENINKRGVVKRSVVKKPVLSSDSSDSPIFPSTSFSSAGVAAVEEAGPPAGATSALVQDVQALLCWWGSQCWQWLRPLHMSQARKDQHSYWLL